MTRIIRWSILALMVAGFIALAILFDLISVTEQVTNAEASTKQLADSQAGIFALVVGGILSAVLVTGGGLGLIIYLANRSATRAEAAPDNPRNPLEYKTYGMLGAFAFPVGLAMLWVLILLGIGILPEQASEQAETVDLLFQVQFLVMSIIFGIVVGLFLHALFYFRATEGDTGDGEFIHGNNMLEITWTFIPAVIVAVLGVWTIFLFTDVMEEKDNEVTIQVTGQQWVWQFEYPLDAIPEDIRRTIDPERMQKIGPDGNPLLDEDGNPVMIESFSSPDLYLLIDQPIVFELNSADVLHSFWIPQMRIKQDVVPGVTTEIRYTPISEGQYQVVCTEMCGLLHSQMLADVYVVGQGAYREWIIRSLDNLRNPLTAGENIYNNNCITCHTLDGSDGTGPTWEGLYGSQRNFVGGGSTTADYDYLMDSIVNPNNQIASGYTAGVMPQNYNQSLSPTELNQIIAFIIAISDDGTIDEELQALESGLSLEELLEQERIDAGLTE